MLESKDIIRVLEGVTPRSLRAVLNEFTKKFPSGRAAFSTSFSLEDQAITHLIATEDLPVRIFTLDTGRHFTETYKTLDQTRARYSRPIEVFFPDTQAVQKLVREKGAFSFYESLENRLECCNIRKVEPLGRALKNVELWITGIRRAHSPERSHLPFFEIDHTHNLVKFHPLLDWSDTILKEFLREHDVPYNALSDRGFLSIGCEPCTRPVEPGGDVRSGRWWWERAEKKECGLHLHK